MSTPSPTRLRRPLLATWAGLLLAAAVVAAWAAPLAAGTGKGHGGYSGAAPRRVVLVLLSGVSLEDLCTAPTTGIRALLATGAAGLLNTRTGTNMGGRTPRAIDSQVLHPEEIRPTTLEAGCLTIGAGTRSFVRGEGGAAFEREELVDGLPACGVWEQRTGVRAGRDRIIHLYVPRIAVQQEALSYPAVPGALGQALREAGLPTAVVGNADDQDGPHREAVCIAMDHLGRVPLGAVGTGLTRPDPLVPGGRRTDAEAVLRATDAAIAAGARFIVVETGEGARMDRAADDIQEAIRPQRRRKAVSRADRLVVGLRRRLDPRRTLFLLVSAATSRDAAHEGHSLAPLVMAGPGIPAGLILSPSTRTPGLAVNTDIAPTVLAFLGVPVPPQMVGRPIGAVPRTGGADLALRQEREYRRIEDYARPLARWLAWALVALFGLSLFLAYVRPGTGLAGGPAMRQAALALAALPASILLVGLLAPASPLEGAVYLALLVSLLALVASRLERWLSPPGALWLAAAVLAIQDLVTGNTLLRMSPLAYSPYSGARYYGLGNEGLGLLLPSLVLGVLLVAPRAGTGAVGAAGVLALVAAVLIGHPRVGADFGGALTGAVTGAAAGYFALRGRLSRRALAGIGAVAVLVAALPIGVELLSGVQQQSHIGRAMAAVGAGGAAEAWSIISRKLGMALRLLHYSPWSRLLVVSSVALGLMLREYRIRLVRENPTAWAGVVTVIAGAAAAFLVNDSGVQPAAQMVVAAGAAVAWLVGGTEARTAREQGRQDALQAASAGGGGPLRDR